jgi:hypothetical protein
MPAVPDTLVARWSQFHRRLADAEVLLNACLDGLPAAKASGLSLQAVHRAGWRSVEAQALVEHACVRMTMQCEGAQRSLHNVALQEGLLPTWSARQQRFPPGTAIHITAPLCLVSTTGGEATAFLHDYPPLARMASDETLPLQLSPTLQRQLIDHLGEAAAWHPFCKILGFVRQVADAPCIEVIQVEFAVPLPFYSALAASAWEQGLLREAACSSSAQGARSFTPAQAGDLALPLAEPDGANGFWCTLATLLPAWKKQFALTPATVHALLASFDHRFDRAWRLTVGNAAIASRMRYSVAVMAEARSRLAALAVPPAVTRKRLTWQPRFITGTPPRRKLGPPRLAPEKRVSPLSVSLPLSLPKRGFTL